MELYASLQYTDPVTAALILALSPIVTAVISLIGLKKERKYRFGSVHLLPY
ncbi:hypothetical protein ACI2OX_02075 [Bacillus sp. N9]